MRVTILAFGTRGDVQPLIAFGLGLQSAGHTVRFVTQETFCELAADHGVQCDPIPVKLQLPSQKKIKTGRLSHFHLYKLAREYMKDALIKIWEVSQYSEAIIFSDWGRIPGIHISEKLDIPAFMFFIHPQQMQFLYPETHVYGHPLAWIGSWIRKQLLWHIAFKGLINQWRQESLELPPAPFMGNEAALKKKRVPFLYAHSPTVFPRPESWPNWLHVTGYCFLDHSQDWHPPKDLVRFLAIDPPPIYVGFSSMSNRKVDTLTNTVTAALSATNQRGILVSGWSDFGKSTMQSADVFTIKSIPHNWLFSKISAAIHHGGSGTAAAAFRAGIPQIIIPFAIDQPFWGWRASELGVGTSISPKRLTAEKLAAAIDQVIHDETIRQRAAALGAKIRAEDGVNRAVELFNQYVKAANT